MLKSKSILISLDFVKTILLYPIFIGMAISCAHKPHATKPVVVIDEKIFVRQLQAIKGENLSASFDIEIEGEERISGAGEWITQQGTHARFEISDPLGRVHYLCIQNQQKMIFYYPTQRVAYKDKYLGRSYFQQFLNLPISYKEFENILTGQYLKVKKSVIVETKIKGEPLKVDYTFQKNQHPKKVRLYYRNLKLFVEWGEFEVLKKLIEETNFELDLPKEVKILELKHLRT